MRMQRVDDRVGLHCLLGRFLVHLRVRRNAQLVVREHEAAEHVLRRVRAEVQAQLRAIGQLLAVRRVVHLEVEGRLGRQQDARFRRQIQRLHAGHVVVQADRATPLGTTGGSDDVMHDGALAGQPVDGPHPHVTIERILDLQHLIRNRAGRRHFELRQLDDQVGLAERPLRPILLLREQRIGAAAARRAGLDPVHERARLIERQPTVVD